MKSKILQLPGELNVGALHNSEKLAIAVINAKNTYICKRARASRSNTWIFFFEATDFLKFQPQS